MENRMNSTAMSTMTLQSGKKLKRKSTIKREEMEVQELKDQMVQKRNTTQNVTTGAPMIPKLNYKKESLITQNKNKFIKVYDMDQKKPLGTGGFGVVYKCVHKELKAERAVKVID